MNTRLSTVVQRAKVELDEAIDHVAARMTAVEKDDALAARIAGSLPERAIWFPRLWISRFAMGALATLAIIVVLRTFNDRSTDVLRTEGAPTPSVEPPLNDRRTSVERSSLPVEHPLIVRRTTGEPPSNDRRADADHAFSLVAIDTPSELWLDPLAPTELPSESYLVLAPLVIADLPLTAEFPMKEE